MESEDPQQEETSEPQESIPEITAPKHPAFDDAMDARSAADSQQAMAAAEERLWQMADVDARKTYKRQVWIAGILKIDAAYEIGMRGRLVHAPQNLWDRVDDADEPMPLSTAVRIIKDARQVSLKERISITEAVGNLLEEYDKLPVFSTQDGKKFRRRTGVHMIRKKNTEAMGGAQGRGWWARLRQVVGNLVSDKIPPDADEVAREDLYKWLDREIRAIIDQFGSQAAKLPRRGKPAVEINRKQVVEACRVLHIDPPAPGGKVDLAAAIQNKRKFTRAYHPDSHGGDETMRELYEEVIKAYANIEAYAKKNGSKTKVGRDREERKGASHDRSSSGGAQDDNHE